MHFFFLNGALSFGGSGSDLFWRDALHRLRHPVVVSRLSLFDFLFFILNFPICTREQRAPGRAPSARRSARLSARRFGWLLLPRSPHSSGSEREPLSHRILAMCAAPLTWRNRTTWGHDLSTLARDICVHIPVSTRIHSLISFMNSFQTWEISSECSITFSICVIREFKLPCLFVEILNTFVTFNFENNNHSRRFWKKKSKYFGSDISLQSLHSSTFKILGSNNSILLDDGCNSLNDSTNSAMCAVCCCRFTFPTVMAEAKQFLTRNDPESLPFSLPPYAACYS
jgi:hypothetical protein